jgi:putative phage-type endonuclease
MNSKKLVNVSNLTKEEWLKYKQNGISGTDIGCIAGINPYKSAIAVYLEKTQPIEEYPDNDAMKFGRLLEPIIAKEFQERNPEYKVQRVNFMLQHKEHDWAIANIDRLIVNKDGKQGILEVKTANAFKNDQWEAGKPNDEYLLQLQWYLFVTGLDYGFFAVLCGGQRYHQIYIERDDELISYIFTLAEDFWRKVLTHQIPQIDGSEASTNVLNAIYKVADENKPTVQLESSIENIIEEREVLKKQVKELEEKINFADNTLKSLIGDAEAAETSNYVVTWKNCNGKSSLDSKKLKAEMPEVYNKYYKQGNSYRTLKVNRKVE